MSGGNSRSIRFEECKERKGSKGFVFDIQRYSIHDGPGIRTTIFLKGCPLQCAWCHNPESQSGAADLAFYPVRCIGCGNCVSACPNGCHVLNDRHVLDSSHHDLRNKHDLGGNAHEIRRADCITCGKCTESCFSKALTLVGSMMTVTEVIDEVMADRLFYDVSGGGMTVSGGEPMFQPDFALELLKAAKDQGIHTCLDTCGFCPPEEMTKMVPHTDLFLFDLKTTADNHERWTGVPLEPILRTLHALDDSGGKITLRCPLIPGVNMNDAHLKNIAGIATSLKNIIGINIEPYHPVGISKCEATGREPEFAEPNLLGAGEAEKWADKLRKMTDIPVTVV